MAFLLFSYKRVCTVYFCIRRVMKLSENNSHYTEFFGPGLCLFLGNLMNHMYHFIMTVYQKIVKSGFGKTILTELETKIKEKIIILFFSVFKLMSNLSSLSSVKNTILP